jgi:hypothetical protein
MSIFNPHPTTQIQAYIEREKRRQAREAEEVAVEALQIGLAFEDDEELRAAEEEELLLENPQFDAALKAFAQMEKLS